LEQVLTALFDHVLEDRNSVKTPCKTVPVRGVYAGRFFLRVVGWRVA
jgi:hypothetical protein